MMTKEKKELVVLLNKVFETEEDLKHTWMIVVNFLPWKPPIELDEQGAVRVIFNKDPNRLTVKKKSGYYSTVYLKEPFKEKCIHEVTARVT
eukprot:UN00717